MKKLIPLLGILLLLTSCYSNPNDLEKIKELENKIEKNNIEQQEYLFKKKKECSEICSKIYDKQVSDSDFTYFNPVYFYNKDKNTCYYEGGYINDKTFEKSIQNCLSNEIELLFIKYDENVITISNEEFERELNKLKNN